MRQSRPPNRSSCLRRRLIALEMKRWLSHLGTERRLSAKTLEAYERDVRQCLVFSASISARRSGSRSLPS